MELSPGDIVMTPDGKTAEYICSYSNGYFTSAGLYEDVALCEYGPVIWSSSAAMHLPVRWPYMLWEDDRGVKQEILMLLTDRMKEDEDAEGPVFLMADGYVSWEVKEVLR